MSVKNCEIVTKLSWTCTWSVIFEHLLCIVGTYNVVSKYDNLLLKAQKLIQKQPYKCVHIWEYSKLVSLIYIHICIHILYIYEKYQNPHMQLAYRRHITCTYLSIYIQYIIYTWNANWSAFYYMFVYASTYRIYIIYTCIV